MVKLTGDESIKDVIKSLAKPESYVRGVLGNMAEFRRRDLEPCVRIGATGQGIYPHYRIDPVDADDTDVFKGLEDFFQHMTVFNGRNHKPMVWTALDIKGEHWSAGEMTFEDVQNLLGELRGYKGRRDL